MRVVYVNPCGQMGGAETSLRELLSSVRAAAPDWKLSLILGEDGPMSHKARELGVNVVVLPFPAALAGLGDTKRSGVATAWSLLKALRATVSYARRLGAAIQALQPDIVHTNGFKMHLLCAWACKDSAPLVWHIHDYVSARPLMSKFLRRFSSRCATAIVNSDSVGNDLKSLIPGLRIVTIYNAVDLRRFAPAGSQLDLDRLAGLAPARAGTIRVGLVGTFARWKGHKVFLRALSLLPGDTAIRGYVIGGAIYQTGGSQWSLAELREEVTQLGIADRVGFTGFLDDAAAAMRSLDIVVHASTEAEPFGMVIAEGMGCGKAVIAARAGGASELFVDGKTAIGCTPGDPAELARQIQRLASDEGLRKELGAAGRIAAERSYTRERLAAELLQAYQNSFASPARPPAHSVHPVLTRSGIPPRSR